MYYSIVSDAIDSIKGWFESLIQNVLFRIFYWLESQLLRLLALVEDTMKVFTGERNVTYNTKNTSLIDVFFSHDAIRGVYTGVAIIGIIIAFGFAVIAVIRKIGDLRDKQQGMTLGAIIGNLLKSVLLIVGMNAIVLVAVGTANVLTLSIGQALTNYQNYTQGDSTFVFTNEQYAAMGRIINTIGNYSLNPSYRSRYNLNACYNDIRRELQYLGEQGVLNFHYKSVDAENKEEETWQSLMEKLGTAYDYTRETPLDSYDDGLTNALLDCIEILRTKNRMRVLQEMPREVKVIKGDGDTVPIDRIMFLVGTMGTFGNTAAARNDVYNQNPSFYDSVRLPFYVGDKDIYDWDAVKTTFDPSPTKTNYILVYVVSIAMLLEMVVIIVTCSVRIFNLLALYIASPLAIAALPLDDGGKFKQWITAFVVQLLGVVGMVISMRLLLIFLPIIWSPSLTISKYMILDCIVKAVITYGGLTAVNKVNGIFTGILADQAGYQAILAGDVRGQVQNSAVGKAIGAVSGASVGKAIANKVGGAASAVGGAGKNFVGKWAGKAAEATGLASVGRSIRGVAESAGFVKKHDESKDPAHVQHARERGRVREMNSLKSDVDYASQHGTHRNGKALKSGELQQMKHTLKHMEVGKTLSQARRLAEVDVQQDKLDAQREGRERAAELPTNQRNQGGENPNPLPENQRDQGGENPNPLPGNQRNQGGENPNPLPGNQRNQGGNNPLPQNNDDDE